MMIVRKKKADVSSQSFIYILGLIIIGMMFYFSIKWIYGLIVTSEKIDTVQLKTDIEGSFKGLGYGDSRTKTFRVGSKITKVCFFDTVNEISNYGGYGICDSGKNDFNPDACFKWKNGEALYLETDADFQTEIFIDKIYVADPHYMCFNTTNGNIEVMLVGRGSSVEVRRPVYY